MLSFHAVLLYVLPLLLAIQYRDGKALWFAFGVNTVTMTASMLPLNENPSLIIVAYGAFPRTIILFVFALMLRNTILTSHEDERRIAALTICIVGFSAIRPQNSLIRRTFRTARHTECARKRCAE